MLIYTVFDNLRRLSATLNYDEEEVEAFYTDLERIYREGHTFFKVIIGDFNAKIGPRRSFEERHIRTHGLEWNEQGKRLSEFITATYISIQAIHSNSQFQKPYPQRWTWESPNLPPIQRRLRHWRRTVPRNMRQ
uniref:Endo/exonuclease/phosphatase domain-containing protein n=1 Tax=Angiostrongylus cantonensis TaxID=6313 RepID=A0A0K0DJM3_ANGCA